MIDFILNGQGSGQVAERLLATGGDPGTMRPWRSKKDGRTYVTLTDNAGNQRNQLVNNADATLSKDDWVLLDEMVIRVAKPRLRAWTNLLGNNLSFNIPNGMSKFVVQHQNLSDITEATASMDGLRHGDRDRPEYEIQNLPLPIIHKDFSFSLREVMVSRTSANQMGPGPALTALDTTSAELAARRVAESVEQLLLGVATTYSFGGYPVYGYTNFPSRATKTMTAPTGANAATTLAEVLDMKYKSQQMYHFGPWMLYASTSWDQYLDNDYILSGGNVATQTLRERLKRIDGIIDVMTVDYLPAKTMALVQMTSDVVRAVNGMQINTVSWETHGGFQLNFKIMCIMVPQLRADKNGNTGIVHGTHV